MLNIISHFRLLAQGNFMDELRDGVDYGDESEDEYGLPWEDFIEDNIEEEPLEPETQYPTTGLQPQPPQTTETPGILEPIEEELGGYAPGDTDMLNGEELYVADSYDDINALIRDSLQRYVIKIDYTTIDGRFTGDRVVEPHRTFVAGTGNNILLTFDRTVGDIRGFVIGNIKPGAVLYENTFDVKPEIMRPRPKRRPIAKGGKPRKQVSKRR